jgi:hypothetical protein
MKKTIILIAIMLAATVAAFAQLGPDAGTPVPQLQQQIATKEQQVAERQVILREYICQGDRAGTRRVQSEIRDIKYQITKIQSDIAYLKANPLGGTPESQAKVDAWLQDRGYITEGAVIRLLEDKYGLAPLASLPATTPPATPGTTAPTTSTPPVTPAGDPMAVINWLAANWWWLLIVAVVLVLVLRTNVAALVGNLFGEWDTRPARQPGEKRTFNARGRHAGVRWEVKNSWEDTTP